MAEPSALEGPDEERTRRLEVQLRALRDDLGGRDAATVDEDLLWRADALRAVLESVYGTRLVFAGEDRPATEVFSGVDVEEVSGYVAAIRGHSDTKGRLQARMRVLRVEPGGQAIGVDLRGDS